MRNKSLTEVLLLLDGMRCEQCNTRLIVVKEGKSIIKNKLFVIDEGKGIMEIKCRECGCIKRIVSNN